jgi:hypothetical protein
MSKSKWELWKEKHDGDPARPWDLINPKIKEVSSEVYLERLKDCYTCDRFIKISKQCKECGCVMTAKAKLPHAVCPIGKWGTSFE